MCQWAQRASEIILVAMNFTTSYLAGMIIRINVCWGAVMKGLQDRLHGGGIVMTIRRSMEDGST